MCKYISMIEDSVVSPIAWWYPLCNRLHDKTILVTNSLTPGDVNSLALLCKTVIYIKDAGNCNNLYYDNVVLIERTSSEIKNYDIDYLFSDLVSYALNNLRSINDLTDEIQEYKDLYNPVSMCLLVRNPNSFNSYRSLRVILTRLIPFNNNPLYYNLINRLYLLFGNNRNIMQYPCIMYNNVVYEMLTRYGYRSSKNSHRLMERLKSLVYSPFLYKTFTDCNSLIINDHSIDFDDVLLEKFDSLSLNECSNQVKSHITKKQLDRGKILLSISTHKYGDPEYIAIVALTKKVETQRDNEYSTLLAIQEDLIINKYLPEVGEKAYINDVPCYFVQELKGVTIDYAHHDIERLTCTAYDLLKEITIHTVKSDKSENSKALLNTYIDRFNNRAPYFINKADLLKCSIYAYFSENKIHNILMHGDYKIENVVFDEACHKEVGIIDWELSNTSGFILFDVFFLLIYNRMSCCMQTQTFEAAIIDFLSDDLKSYERKILNDYTSVLNIPPVYKMIMLALFFIHHYSYRRMIRNPATNDIDLINKILDMFIEKTNVAYNE